VVLALVTLCPLTACDRLGEIVLVPETEFVDSFESGTGSWDVRTADLGTPAGVWTVQGTQAAASDGVRSMSLRLDNTGGAAKVWIVRQVELTPSQEYDVAVGFDLGTPDAGGTSPWTLIAGAYPTEPLGAAGLTFRGGTVPDPAGPGPLTWVQKSYDATLRATPQGKGVVVLGLWGTTAEDRTYYLDNVKVAFTRR
jgi:hypothetical protein